MAAAMSIRLGFLFTLCSICFIGRGVPQAAEDWNRWAREDLERALELEKLNTNTAKNVIVFLGDGMGIPTIVSARIYKGQLDGGTGEENSLFLETLPRACLIKTYNTDYQVPDSAGTATAVLSGINTKNGVIGFDDSALRSDCNSSKNAEIESVSSIAVRQGKVAGIVTTTRITHASPAAVYAHSPERDWESSADGDCVDIAAQFIEKAADFKVVLGGGRREFMTNTAEDPEHSSSKGRRTDGRDLISEWRNLSAFDGLRAEYVWKQDDFDAVDIDSTDYLLGLFESSHMQYEADRANDVAGEPSLAEMVEKAIQMLSKNDKGFFLFVEGGRIDHAHHGTLAYKALVDTLAFDDAVKKALEMTDTEDTLVIVTADHSHVNTINGYPRRGNPILGKTGGKAIDDLPYTTIMYTNGPSGKEVIESLKNNGTRPDITDVDTEAPDYLQQALLPLNSETHGGEDISLHADGPYSHLFQNIHEQNYIAHVIKYAACLGEYTDACDSRVSAGKTGDVAVHGLPCTTISYANGPSGKGVGESFRNNGTRPNVTGVDTAGIDKVDLLKACHATFVDITICQRLNTGDRSD